MEYPTWQITRYGQIVKSAEIAVATFRAEMVPLPREAAYSGNAQGRQTEWAACFLWRKGYLPGFIGVQDTYWTLPAAIRGVRLDWKWLNTNPNPHADENRRKCCECGEWKDLSSEYWHRDPKGRNGWQTKCKDCRNDEALEYMTIRRAA